jgi:hypothetical protein
MLFWLAVSAIIILPSSRALPGLKDWNPAVGGLVFFVLFPLSWLYALMWTVSLFFKAYTKEAAWWWVSIPYSLSFTLVVLSSGGRVGMWFHAVSELFLLYYATSLVAVVWTLLKAISLTVHRSKPLTRRDKVMLTLGSLASLSWLLVLETSGRASAST